MPFPERSSPCGFPTCPLPVVAAENPVRVLEAAACSGVKSSTTRLPIRFQVLRPNAANRAEQDPAQLTRVDRLMDGRHADTEPLGGRAHWEEQLRSQELRSPQIRRNLVRGRVSTPSIGGSCGRPSTEAAASTRVSSRGCEDLPLPPTVGTDAVEGSGPRGRRFKSCLPGQFMAPRFRRSRGAFFCASRSSHPLNSAPGESVFAVAQSRRGPDLHGR